jgi:hypothetical protein
MSKIPLENSMHCNSHGQVFLSMANMLDIYCGSNALKTIQERGIKQELLTTMLGASGGLNRLTHLA